MAPPLAAPLRRRTLSRGCRRRMGQRLQGNNYPPVRRSRHTDGYFHGTAHRRAGAVSQHLALSSLELDRLFLQEEGGEDVVVLE